MNYTTLCSEVYIQKLGLWRIELVKLVASIIWCCTANRSEQSPSTYSMIKLEVFGPGWQQNFILFEPNQEKFEFFKNISATRRSWNMEMNI